MHNLHTENSVSLSLRLNLEDNATAVTENGTERGREGGGGARGGEEGVGEGKTSVNSFGTTFVSAVLTLKWEGDDREVEERKVGGAARGNGDSPSLTIPVSTTLLCFFFLKFLVRLSLYPVLIFDITN